MTIQTINLGTGTSGIDGDTNRSAFAKVNANFAELNAKADQGTSNLQAQIDDNLATLSQQDATNKAALEQQIGAVDSAKAAKEQNLADLPNKEAARTNLDVPSRGQSLAMSVALG